MPNQKSPWLEKTALRLALLRQKHGRSLRGLRQPRTALMVILGASLSIGGVSEAFNSVQFLVRKDLDTVAVVKKAGDDEKVVATVQDSFAGNSLFKLARALPDRYVRQEMRLFDSEWMKTTSYPEKVHEELSLINDSIREEFFASSIPFGDLIHEKATKYDVNPALVAAVIEQESRFKSRAKSHAGARGLMQLMPRTGRWMGAKDLYDPDQNIDAGTKYLKYLEKKFDGDLKKTLAAYNAGEGTVARFGGIPPYRETRHYVKVVMKNYERRTRELDEFTTDFRKELAAETPSAPAAPARTKQTRASR